jgi:transposase-like protein
MPPLPANKKYSPAEMERLFKDIMDPTKVNLVCGRHNYVASEKPPQPNGCKNCWEVWWWHKIATTPAAERLERLEQAMAMVRHANEAYERGEFDFEPEVRAAIKYEQGKEPD